MTTLIAEVGLAHEGSAWLAHSYIDAIADAGAQAVKCQAHTPWESSPEDTWRTPPPTGESRADYWARTAFDAVTWAQLASHARDRGLRFGLSLFHDSLLPLADLCDFLKVPSGAATYRPLLDGMAATGRPVYIADGLHPMTVLPDNWTRLICTSKYPCPVGAAGVNEIRAGVDGLSDHTGEPLTAALAAMSGAVAVEAHVTFDRRTGLADAAASLTLDGLAEARRLMTLATAARQGERPAIDPAMVHRYGYAKRRGVWCKPAA